MIHWILSLNCFYFWRILILLLHEDFVYVYAETLNSIWFGEESGRRSDGDVVCQRRLLQQGSLWDMVHIFIFEFNYVEFKQK